MKHGLLFFVFAFFGYTCSPVRQYADSAQAWEKDILRHWSFSQAMTFGAGKRIAVRKKAVLK